MSPYFNLEEPLDTLTTKLNQFSILSLNCASLNAKYDEIKILIESLRLTNYMFVAICIQETWLSDSSDKSLDCYNLIAPETFMLNPWWPCYIFKRLL